MMRLCTDTPNVTAIPPHVSPAATVYSNGTCSVALGARVGSCVSVGVAEGVAVWVWVGMAVGLTTRFAALRPAYTTVAPTARNRTRRPSATGRLNVTSGMRAAWTDFSAWRGAADGFAFGLRSVPHTGQRTAVSDRRVPQVGHTWVF